MVMRAGDLAATAEEFEKRAERTIDPLLATSLLRRARQLREMAIEVDVFQRDPLYRSIHDRPPNEGLDERRPT
jgi:hypothetical protein